MIKHGITPTAEPGPGKAFGAPHVFKERCRGRVPTRLMRLPGALILRLAAGRALRQHGAMRPPVAILLPLMVLLMASPAPASDILAGRATALDGMTVMLSTPGQVDRRVRLWGVIAPALNEPGGDGWFARAVLEDILVEGGHGVTCSIVIHGGPPPTGTCRLNAPGQPPGRDLGLAMISAGWALHVRYPSQELAVPGYADLAQRYRAAEEAAREARRGRWARLPGP